MIASGVDTTMKKINRGEFRDKVYVKYVSFAEAVLWMTKEISLPPEIVQRFREMGTERVVFIDTGKGEQWVADVETLRKNYKLKTMFQERQYYFPISVFTSIDI